MTALSARFNVERSDEEGMRGKRSGESPSCLSTRRRRGGGDFIARK